MRSKLEDFAVTRFSFSAALAFVALSTAASPTQSARAGEFDCSFFEAQAHYKDDIDFSVRMRDACRALAAYRERLVEENVRYAFGDDAVRLGDAHVKKRNAPLDTFHVLPESKRYAIARDTGVFTVINELPN